MNVGLSVHCVLLFVAVPGMSNESSEAPRALTDKPALSDAQRAHIERSRQKALLLKQKRAKSRPYIVPKPK